MEDDKENKMDGQSDKITFYLQRLKRRFVSPCILDSAINRNLITYTHKYHIFNLPAIAANGERASDAAAVDTNCTSVLFSWSTLGAVKSSGSKDSLVDALRIDRVNATG
jgi:hypothetical protein